MAGRRRHYVYLLTRALPEGGSRYYVGIRTCPVGRTPETDTSYMGGGDWIRRAVNKHRAEFTKSIVDVCDTSEEAKAMERALVGPATANSPWSYNLMEGGGSGGLKSEAAKAKMRAARLALFDDPEYKAKHDAATGAANRALAQDPAWQEANTAAQRRPEVRAKKRAAKERRFAEDPAALEQARANMKLAQESVRSYWASLTPAERSAEMKRRWVVRRANKREAA